MHELSGTCYHCPLFHDLHAANCIDQIFWITASNTFVKQSCFDARSFCTVFAANHHHVCFAKGLRSRATSWITHRLFGTLWLATPNCSHGFSGEWQVSDRTAVGAPQIWPQLCVGTCIEVALRWKLCKKTTRQTWVPPDSTCLTLLLSCSKFGAWWNRIQDTVIELSGKKKEIVEFVAQKRGIRKVTLVWIFFSCCWCQNCVSTLILLLLPAVSRQETHTHTHTHPLNYFSLSKSFSAWVRETVQGTDGMSCIVSSTTCQ